MRTTDASLFEGRQARSRDRVLLASGRMREEEEESTGKGSVQGAKKRQEEAPF